MTTDLTVGKSWKVLLKYILPILLSALFQQLYTLADTIIGGKFSGSETALTAIGASTSIVSILMAIALGANAGSAVLCARFFGAKKTKDVKSSVYTSLIAFAIFSLLLLGIGLLTSQFLLEAMGTPQNALEESITYLNVYYLGVPFLILYNLGTGIFSALGDSKTPFIFLVVSSLGNIILDYIMVKPWGVAGVAWATFIAQGIACILTLVLVLKRIMNMKTYEPVKVFSKHLLKLLILLSLPVILQNSFVSLGNLVIQVKINELAYIHGIGITNGFTAGFKILVFCTTCLLTCANGLTNYVSQNYGAKKYIRIKRGFYSSLLITTILTIIFVIIGETLTEHILGIFMEEGPNMASAIDNGSLFVRTVVPFLLIVNIKINADGVVRGCNGNVGFMVSTFSDLILRVSFVFILTIPFGFSGVGWAWNLGWIIGTIIALSFYFNIPVLKKSYSITN